MTLHPAAAAVAAALARAGIELRRDEPLAAHTTLGVGGPVPLFLLPRDTAELCAAVDILGAAAYPFRVLGAGSNLIAADRGLDFAVIATAGLARPPQFDGTRVTADAGVFLPQLVRDAGKHGLTGLEFGIGVPGSVGGALRMNAGAWGSEMSRAVTAVTAVRLADGGAVEGPFRPRFRYRTAGVGVAEVVSSVTFTLAEGDPDAIRDTVTRYAAERRRSQPTAAKSAGCAFRNPEGDAAGRLIDQAGLKGLARGAAQVSERHGNFVLNRGGATAADVLALIAEVKARVADRYGVELAEEIVVWRGSEQAAAPSPFS